MDSPYERLSIRDSVRSLKKYGSTSKHVNKNQKFIKHTVAKTDTLQGLALKYEVTMEDIRRANRMYTSDSLFLKEYLLIPIPEDSPFAAFSESQSNITSPPSEASSSSSRPPSVSSPSYIDNDDVSHFLSKIDSSIANTKAEVRKSSGHSE
ncbi:lysM and putative peptidoglycan-binding domain-containing protein 2 isoform X2 [Agrilus planipennis]|nr:lysM and putative peptidoglycan-binding domain-containing protein 2 isoform X2 [Agrilus planipennis]